MMRTAIHTFFFFTFLCGGLLLPGCAWFGLENKPAAKQPAEQKEKEPPLVVQARDVNDAHKNSNEKAASTPEAEAVDPRVREYIARVDDLGKRANRRPLSTPPANALYPSSRHRLAEDVENAEENSAAKPRKKKPAPPPAESPDDVEDGETAGQASALGGKNAAPAITVTTQPTAPVAPAPPPGPPVLSGVSVRAASSQEPEPSGRTIVPAVNGPAVMAQSPTSLQEFLNQWLANPDDTSFRKQLDARVLQVAAGEYERAREPLTMVSKEQQEIAGRFVEALIAIREGHQGDPTGAANAALRQIEQLAESLRPVSDLSISTLTVCREVRGYGQYQPIEPPHFPAGTANEFVLYCEVRDFVSQKGSDNLYQTRFDLHTKILNRNGDVVLEIKDADIVDRCRNQRRDCFIPRLVRLPATLSPGDYVLKVAVSDKLGGKVAEKHAPLRVIARP